MSRRLRRRLGLATTTALVLSIGLASGALAAPPATNDSFADAKVITSGSLPYTDQLDASSATVEADETVDRCGGTYARSIWYRITPNFNGALRADTIGTDGGDLTIYKGTSLVDLTEVGCNDDLSDDTNSARVAWPVKSGTTYYIRLNDGHGQTVFHLRRVKRPSHDHFGSAMHVTSLPFVHHTSNTNASYQYSEPDSEDVGTGGCSTADPTLWYTIRMTRNTPLRVTVTGAIDTVVAVYSGDSQASLSGVGCNDDTSIEGQGLHSNVAWRAQAGVRYYIQVGGYYGENGPLKVEIKLGKPPANDNFAKAQTIQADGALHRIETTRDATMQLTANEPDPDTCSLGGTVWYRFVAPHDGEFKLDTHGTEFGTALAVYTGASLGSLSPVAHVCGGSDEIVFQGTNGTTYWLQIGGRYGDSGPLHVHLSEPAP